MDFRFRAVRKIIVGVRTRNFLLTATEIADLKRAEQRTKRTHELWWMQAVRLFGTGVPASQIA
jgi:hypothetical protein